jgi:hypothetical protein
MPRTCTVCLHSERAEIDELVLSGEPLRKIAERFSLSVTSLFRHKTHVSETLRKSQEAAEVARAESLTEQLKRLCQDARRIQEKAEAEKDYRAALTAIRELTRLVEFAAKLSGEMAGQQVNVQTNVISTSEGLSIPNAAVLRRLLRTIRSMYGLEAQDGQTSWVIITERQVKELAQKLRQIYGLPITTDQAIKLANDALLLEEVDADEA